MRQPLHIPGVLRYLVILCALCFAARANADDRADARAHYQAGQKFYASGDYRSAIREFSAAQQILPADLNNYNLALCYDKLGDAEPAIQYYRAFLDKQPNTDKRLEIEASISRLEAAARSAATKKAEETRKADDARRAEETRKAEEARRAEEASRAEETRAPALPPVGSPSAGSPPTGSGPAVAPPPSGRPSGPAVAGSIGSPSSGAPAMTGDQSLDRVNSINIDQIREQRLGGASSGMPDPRGGPAVAAGQPPMAGPNGPGNLSGPNGPNGPNGPSGPSSMNGPSGPPLGTDEPKKETPVYKKWWFWAVVAVSGYVVYELATADSTPSRSGRGLIAKDPPKGLTLFSW